MHSTMQHYPSEFELECFELYNNSIVFEFIIKEWIEKELDQYSNKIFVNKQHVP
jgi:hypothetical protein